MSKSKEKRAAELTRKLSPLIAKLYVLDPVRARKDLGEVLKALQEAK